MAEVFASMVLVSVFAFACDIRASGMSSQAFVNAVRKRFGESGGKELIMLMVNVTGPGPH